MKTDEEKVESQIEELQAQLALEAVQRHYQNKMLNEKIQEVDAMIAHLCVWPADLIEQNGNFDKK